MTDLDEVTWDDAEPRTRWGLIVFAAVAGIVVLAVCGVGLVLAKGTDKPSTKDTAAAVPTSPTTVAPTAVSEPAAAPTTAPSSATRTATATKAPTRAPSRNPKATEKPPPAPPRTTAPGCVPTVTGTAAGKPQVRAALDVSAGHTYWRSVPSIRVPARLLYAVAMTESTWRSNVLACDGGIGLMQVMPGTVTQINSRFGTTWDVNTLQGNAHLGANYLAWSVRYLGDLYFAGSYDLDNPVLLDSVIAAYNYGAGAIDPTKGAAGIPNPAYVSSVKGYMAACPCDAW